MKLADRCASEFEQRVWSHGRDYFRSGAVSLGAQTKTSLVAEVRGSSPVPYVVSLDWSEVSERALLVDCSCPRFADVGVCKHLAATILAADAAGIGETIPGRSRLYLEFGDALGAGDVSDGAQAARNALDMLVRSIGPFQSLAPPPRITSPTSISPRPSHGSARKRPDWEMQLADLAALLRSPGSDRSAGRRNRQVCYLLDVAQTLSRGRPHVIVRQRNVKKDGSAGKLLATKLSKQDIAGLESPEERALLGMLDGNEQRGSGYWYQSAYNELSEVTLGEAMCAIVLPRLCATGRFGWVSEAHRTKAEPFRPLAWDDGPAWRLRLDVVKSANGKSWLMHGLLERGEETVKIDVPVVLMAVGWVVFPDRIARFDPGVDFQWTAALRQRNPIQIPLADEEAFLARMAAMPCTPPITWPAELHWAEERPVPQPMLSVMQPQERKRDELICGLSFRYGEHDARFGDGQRGWVFAQSRRSVRRDLDAEAAAMERLHAAGARTPARYSGYGPDIRLISADRMPGMVEQLLAAGWRVEAEGRIIRAPGRMSLSVSSGVDWFDLAGGCDFAGVTASLPALLAAHERGDRFIRLDDGTQGILPAEWLARYTALAELGRTDGDSMRFLPAQAMLLDALLAADDAARVSVDAQFAGLRDRLQSFSGIHPRQPGSSFTGRLRNYQGEALGWLHFLDEVGFGGCLADDMGLGKTVQVLAFLDGRRQLSASMSAGQSSAESTRVAHLPSLIVVPRSLVFNWMEEAAKFTPELRVRNCTGTGREFGHESLAQFDIVLTTYGTLRRDVARLREVEFDYAILDEAQAIKNATAQTTKACRLLRARRRLALTGTPVENHLGDIWSLFEFLNPGMLGRRPELTQLFGSRRGARPPGSNGDGRTAGVALLAKALRPFILRRTKQQVLADLPAKSEQTVYCELSSKERELYDELRDHYRRALMERVRKQGINRSKIHVLEALLRLRQAACHPGLLDKARTAEGSSKLQTLLAQLAEVVDEGHKVLVFSQFTSFLAIVREALDQRSITYEYLDGQTVKRQEKVNRFQTDPDCPVFLISLKAGGQGLNLTAADYVFILDPWWNPAVEAQAIDRTHRIGQQRPVFAYRLIARDTVEEKILQLQADKRGLAEAIISEDNSLLRTLSMEDIQMLLS